jgi:Ca2+-binding EF-hand superfamily protein
MHPTRMIFVPAAAFALMLGTAHAASGDKQSRDVPNFNQMDKNNDGALTRSEAAANPRLLAHFDKVDDDGDGKLTRGEYLAVMARQDLHTVRETLAEFIDPEGKPPMSVGQQPGSGAGQQASAQQRQGVQAPPMAASAQLVRNVQDKLNAKGVDAGPVDGIWGPRTHQGVREFQEKQGLKPTGQLNGQTLAALGIEGEQTASAGESASAGASGRQAGSGERGAPRFEQADKNNDGYVSRQEFDSALERSRIGQTQ